MGAPVDLRYELERRPWSAREEAAEWLLRLHAGDRSVADRLGYLEWLKKSPVHISEALQQCMLYSCLFKLKPLTIERDSERSAQAGAAVEFPADPLRTPLNARPRPSYLTRFAVRWRSIAAVVAILFIALGALWMTWAALQSASQAAGGGGASVAVPGGGNPVALAVDCTGADTHTSATAECAKRGIRNWSLRDWQGLCAFAAVVPLTLVILIRRRKVTLGDVGPLVATFLAAGSIPVAIRLCSIGLPIPRGQSTIVFVEQHALHISAAGCAFLLICGMTICQFFVAQYRGGNVTSSRLETPVSNLSARSCETPQADQERRIG